MQGLLPLKELNVCEIEAGKSPGQEDHAFRITGRCLRARARFGRGAKGALVTAACSLSPSALVPEENTRGEETGR